MKSTIQASAYTKAQAPAPPRRPPDLASNPATRSRRSSAVRLGRSETSTGQRGSILAGALILHANEAVSADRLALSLWGEDAPTGAATNVQVHVSRLRKALGEPGLLTTTPGCSDF